MIIADRVKQLEEEIQSVEERLSDVRQTASGEANTASNIGVGGIGVYDQKVGVDLQFRNIIAASPLITVALNAGNNEIEIDADPSQIDLDDLGDINIAGIANNDILFWNVGAGEWQVKAEAGGVGDVTAAGNIADDYIVRGDGGAKGIQDSLLYITDTGLLCLNETVNTKMTIGITVNQGSADNEIQAGKSSDINHGITSRAETDTFYKFQKTNGAYGGLNIECYQEVSGSGACLNLGAFTKHSKAGALGPTNAPTINLQAVYCGGGTDRMPAPAGFVLGSWSTYDSTGNWRHKWQINQEGNTWQLGGIALGNNIIFSGAAVRQILHSVDNQAMYIGAGSSYNHGASIQFYGDDHGVYPGSAYIVSGSHDASPASIIEFAYRNAGAYQAIMRLGADRHVDIWDWDDAAMREISFGPDDSGGAGFKVLRVPN